MKFIADCMLGKLTRWLRLAGHDVIYIGDLDVPANEQDNILISHATGEKRILLTCDVDLHHRARKTGSKSIFIKSNDVVGQLVEISKRCGHKITIRPENSRCPMCNGAIERADKKEIEGKVPGAIFGAHREFWLCSTCGKIYWQGKHWKTILDMASRYDWMVK